MIRHISLIVLFGILLAGCGSPNTNKGLPEKEKKQELPADEDLFPISKSILHAEGWEKLTIKANSAKTEVNTTAHFNTDRNACGKNAYGSMNKMSWEILTQGLNDAVVQMAAQPRTPLAPEYCVDRPDTVEKFLDESATLKLERGEILLFEVKDGQICTKIQNKKLSNDLLNAITDVILLADKEDCANGYGRN